MSLVCGSTLLAGPSSSAGLLLAIVTLWLVTPAVGIVLLVLTTFFLFSFATPERQVSAPDTAVLSPADGRVMVAGASTTQRFRPIAGSNQHLLSPMDVHVNRLPVSGRVLSVKYHPGRFLPAYRSDAGELNDSRRSRSITAAAPSSYGRSSASWRGGSCAGPKKVTSSELEIGLV